VRGRETRCPVAAGQRVDGHRTTHDRRRSVDGRQRRSVAVAAAADARRRSHRQHLLHVQETAFSSRVTSHAARGSRRDMVAHKCQLSSKGRGHTTSTRHHNHITLHGCGVASWERNAVRQILHHAWHAVWCGCGVSVVVCRKLARVGHRREQRATQLNSVSRTTAICDYRKS